MKLVGYRISGFDNGTCMFDAYPSNSTCSKCGMRLDLLAYNPLYVSGKFRRSSLLYTYDGFPIVSQQFKDFIELQGFPNVDCHAFVNDPRRFFLTSKNIVPYDCNSPYLERDEYCSACERFVSVATGSKNAFVTLREPLPNGIFQTDLTFGHQNEQSPILLVGIETKRLMEKFGLRGISYGRAYRR